MQIAEKINRDADYEYSGKTGFRIFPELSNLGVALQSRGVT